MYSPLSAVLISQITQVLEGKKTKHFKDIQIPDDYKVGMFHVLNVDQLYRTSETYSSQ